MYRTESNPNASFSAAAHAAADRRLSSRNPARYRSRDFGSGYGSSSGYAADRRYTPGSQPASRFRLV